MRWFRETVIKSIKSCADDDIISMKTINDMLSFSFIIELPVDQLFQTTKTSRSHHWIDNLLVSSIANAMDRIEKQQQQNENVEEMKTQTKSSRLALELHDYLRSTTNSREILKILLRKLKQEAQLSVAFEAIDKEFLIEIICQMKNLKKVLFIY